MMTLHDLDKYVRSQGARRPPAPHPEPGRAGRHSRPQPVAAALRARSLSARKTAMALSRPLDYAVPGIVSEVRQPSPMACWAAAYAMLAGWRTQRAISIEAALAQAGQKWVDKFRADTGLLAEEETEFYAAVGLHAEPLAGRTLEAWEGLLREYGPLLVIVDVDPGEARRIDALVMAGIHGDGTPAGTAVTVVDPSRGRRAPTFAEFLSQYEQGSAHRTKSGRLNQIVHWPKDVKFARAGSVAPRAFTGAPAASGEPWSTFFHFRKGAAFDVDGPLSYDGHGEVLDRTADHLEFTMNMPAVSIFGKEIPKADMVLEATYRKEGKGNLVCATINGVKMEDANAEITSSGTKRTIKPNFTGFSGPLPEWITVSPDGSKEIDLDMKIDGREVDFDLELTRGSTGLSLDLERRAATVGRAVRTGPSIWVRELATSSTPASGLAEVTAFAARTAATRWKLARGVVAGRLRDVIMDPDLVDQGSLNVCGPAVFFHLYARRDPQGFARYAADLFEKGTATIGSLTVKPDDDLVLNDYAAIVPRMTSVTPAADWMCLSALRDSENSTIDFEGDPDENVAGITTPGELADWMKRSGIYNKVVDEGNWALTRGAAHALALAPAANRDIVLLINANIISAPPGKKKLLDAFPNHFIRLLSPVVRTAAGIEFDYWTWGLKPKHAAIVESDFADNYYGSVTGEV